jgi:DNA-binding GntR family transcriptional regulator
MKQESATVLEDAYNLLREGIKDGRFAPGQRLVEVDIVAEFGIGRSTVREILRRLASDRFVDYEPHRGVVVRFLTRAQVEDVYLIREYLEGLSARLAAKNIRRPGNRKKLTAFKKEIRTTELDKNIPLYLKHNEKFHALITELSDSDSLRDLCERLVVPTFRLQFAQQVNVSTIKRALSEHKKVVEAILEGDQDRAESEIRLHIRNAGVMLQGLPDTAFKKDPVRG